MKYEVVLRRGIKVKRNLKRTHYYFFPYLGRYRYSLLRYFSE